MNKFSWIFFILIPFFIIEKSNAQISVSYPTASQSITRGSGSSLLNVKIAFSGACAGTTVSIGLPASVSYVAGSIVKTGGTGAAITISENNITNLNKPVFTLGNITGAGDISFTIRRQAGCGALSTAKDTIRVTGGCGAVTENAAGTNVYNFLSPSLAVTPPATITGAFLGNNYSRTINIVNGGTGCLDTVRFYVVYPAGGIKLQDAPVNSLIANGTSFTPWKATGDTLFYKFFGPTLFAGNTSPNLCNGNNLVITENIKLLKCNTATSYSAYWNTISYPGCQTVSGTSGINMSNGTPIAVGSFTVFQERSTCRPGIYDFKYTNNGSGGKAGALYNVTPDFGYYTNPGNLGGLFIDSVKLGTKKLVLTGSHPLHTTKMSQFLTDPDGVGIGLDDLDGDGQFDDLLPGQSFTLRLYDHIICTSACPFPSHAQAENTRLTYNTMCGGTDITTATLHAGAGYSQKSSTSSLPITGPTQIQGGTSFNLLTCSGGFSPPSYRPHDTAYMAFILPPGVKLSGNALLNDVPIPASRRYVRPGVGGYDTLFLTAKGPNAGGCWSVDLVYTCGGSATLNIPVISRYIGDNSCPCGVQNLQCGTKSVSAICPTGGCASGLSNYQPVAKRTTKGWTNSSMTTKVVSLTGRSSYTVQAYDSLVIQASGVENGTFNNVWYILQLGKATGKSVFNILPGAILKIKNKVTSVITTCSLPLPADSSTATLQKYFWNLSTCLPSGSVTTGDSLWIDVNAVTTGVNNNQLFGRGLQGVPNTQSYFFNYDASSVQKYCNSWPVDLFTNGIDINHNGSFSSVALACNNSTMQASIVLNDGNSYDVFPNEFRPDFSMDSVIVTIPSGYIFNPAVTPTWKNGFWTSAYNASSATTNVTAVLLSGNRVGFYKSSSNLLPSEVMVNGNSAANIISFGILPTCSASPVNVNGTVKFYMKKNAYVPSAKRDTVITNTSPSISYPLLNKPSLTIQNNTGQVQGILAQQYWDVQINNNSTQTAPYIWLALEKSATSGISIDSVVLKPSNQLLTKQNYGIANVWFQESIAGISSGGQQTARVYFKYSNCTKDSILAKAGWNCGGYPTDPTAYACATVQTYLNVDPQPSQIQLTVLRQPGNGASLPVFSSDSLLIGVNSAQAGYLINPYIDVYLPAGIVVEFPMQVEYPSGSGSYQNVVATSIAGGYRLDLSKHTGIGTNGIPGTITNPAAAGRQAKIKIKYSTNCESIKGSAVNVFGYGMKPCGTPAVGNGSNLQSTGIDVTGLPVVDIGNDKTICADGSKVTFDAGANYTGYLWDTGETTKTITTSQAGKHKLTVTDANGCTIADSANLIVNPLPVFDLGSDKNVCVDAPQAIFDAGAVFSGYLWDSGEITKSISTSIAGKHKVTVKDSNNCVASDSVNLIINPLPVFDLGPDKTICANLTATFDAGATFSSYLWNTGESGKTISTSLPGKHKLTVTDSKGCQSSDSANLILNPLPPLDLGPDKSICDDGSKSVFESSAVYPSYLWNTGEATKTISTSLAGKHKLTVTDVKGCVNSDSANLVVNLLPVFDLGSDKNICSVGGTASFDAGAVFSNYLWSTGETTKSITVTTIGKYKLTVTDVNSCSSSDSVNVVPYALPGFDLGPDKAVCADGSTATFNVDAVFSSYSWNTGETMGSITTSLAGKHKVTVVDGNGCVASDSVNLIVNALPVFDLGSDKTVCADGTKAIFDAGSIFLNYQWDSGEITKTISASLVGKHKLTVTDANNCTASDSANLVVNPLPVFDLGSDKNVCADGSTETFDAGAVFASYLWNNGETTKTITTGILGKYKLTVTDNNNCSSSDSVNLVGTALPGFDLGPDKSVCADGSTASFDVGAVFSSYIWNTGESIGSITTSLSGKHKVTVTDANGCVASDSVNLIVNPLPVVDLGADKSVCADGSSASFDAGVFATYLWNTGEVTQTITTALSGQHKVIVTDANNCVASDSANLIINPLPVFDLGPDQKICADGSSATFDAGAVFSNYLWSSGELTQTISKSLAGKYKLTVTDVNNCQSSDSVSLLVNPLPVFDLGSDKYICNDGSTATFDAGAIFTSYLWNTGEATKTLTTSISGIHILKVTDVNTCSSTDTVSLILNPLPIFDLGPDKSICADGSIATFDAGASFSKYLWNTGEVSQSITTSKSGIHILKVTDANNCSSTDTVSLIINPLPVFDLGPDKSICDDGSTATFDAGAVFTNYFWNTGDITQTITRFQAGQYILKVTDGNNCSSNDTVNLKVNPLPVFDLGGDKTICADGSATFDAGATFAGYLWDTGETIRSIATSKAGIHILTVTDANNCSAKDSVNLNVNPLPVFDLGNDKTICADGTSVTFDAGATFITYEWSNGATDKSITTSQEGLYTLKATDANNCSASDSVRLVVNPLPVITAGLGDNVCSPFTRKIGDTNNPEYTYQWTGDVSVLSSTTISDPIISAVNNGNSPVVYNLVLTASRLSCPKSATVKFTVNPVPVIVPERDTSICSNTEYLLSKNVSSVYKYQWEPMVGLSNTSIGTPIFQRENLTNTDLTYTLRLRAENYGCFAYDTVKIEVKPYPVINAGADEISCLMYNKKIGEVPNNSYIYKWLGETKYIDNNQIANPTAFISNKSKDILSVDLVLTANRKECISEDSLTISVYPQIRADAGEDVAVCRFAETILTASEGRSYKWSNGSTERSIKVFPDKSTSYNVVVDNVCLSSDTVKVIVMNDETTYFIPNAFTPDDDDHNDYFYGKGTYIKDLKGSIFNRWGEEIYKWEGVNGKWDGKVNGDLVQIGVYTYMIVTTDKCMKTTKYNGTVTVVR